MNVGKITTVGASVGVVIPAGTLRFLGWMKGDVVSQEVSDDMIILRNVTRPHVKFTHTRKDYGDALGKRS